MLSDDQLFHLADAMGFKLEAICFKDELPNKLKFNVGYIINLQNSEDEEGKQNEGSHWTALQVNKYPSGLIEPIYFDPYGQPPPESVKKFVEKCGKHLPYTDKDVQSLLAGVCGYYCAAFLYWINAYPGRMKDLYVDVAQFLHFFNDLNESADFKFNELMLKQFFRSKDPSNRSPIELFANQSIDDDIRHQKIAVDAKYV
jgi:hypothetical protein